MPKAKSKTKASQATIGSASQFTGTWMVLTFFATWIVNVLVIHLANAFFPYSVVLGTMSVTPLWALVLSSAVIAMAVTFVFPFLMHAQDFMGRVWSSLEMMITYLVINFVSLWFVARAAQIFGLGVRSWLVVLAVAAVLDVVQGGVMVGLEKLRK